MVKLTERHHDHLYLYGKGNEERLTGKHETSSTEKFTYREGDRGCSSRIPVTTMES
jgi:glutamine synthetase